MKINKKIMVPVLALTAFAAIGVGSTYAIFTSEANTNIAVTAGKVSISAVVENVKLYSGVYNEDTAAYDSVEQQTAFLNGGTATVEEGVVTLDKVSPMDKVEFDVKITNASNVTAKYRTLITKLADTGLFEALEVKVNDEAFGGADSYTDWAVVEPTTTEVGTLHVSVELPEAAGNEYQDLSCSIKFAVEAVQGNAHVENVTPACDHEHIAGYVYNENTGALASKVCEDCEGTVAVTNEEVEALAGKMLVKHAGEEYYTVTEKTMAQEVAGQTGEVNFVLGGGADVYSVSGPNSGSYKVNVYGIKNGDEYLSKLYSSNGSTYITVAYDLTIKNVEMVGTTSGGWYRGIQSQVLNCYDCHFTGGTTCYAEEANFTNCTFDATNINNGGKADYSVYCYNTLSTFTDCKFVSAGKAVKIYSEGNKVGNKFEFVNCDFTIGDSLLTAKSDKAAVQIDSNYQTTANPYVVICDGCTQTGYDGGLVADSSTKSTITVK